MRRMSIRLIIRLYAGQNVLCTNVIKIPTSECPGIWIRLPEHKWPKSWSSMGDPVVLLESHVYGHTLAGLIWERQSEKVLLEHGCDFCNLWMFLSQQSKRTLLICVCGRNRNGCQNRRPTWKIIMKEVDYGRSTILFLTMFFLGLHSKRISDHQGYYGRVQKYVRLHNHTKAQHHTLDLWVLLPGVIHSSQNQFNNNTKDQIPFPPK